MLTQCDAFKIFILTPGYTRAKHHAHSLSTFHTDTRGNRSKRKRGGSRNRGSRPSYDVRRILDASPPPKHCLSEPAPHRMRYSHTDKQRRQASLSRRAAGRVGHASTRTAARGVNGYTCEVSDTRNSRKARRGTDDTPHADRRHSLRPADTWRLPPRATVHSAHSGQRPSTTPETHTR